MREDMRKLSREKTKTQFVAYTLYVQGNIPTDLVGEFFRNGANPVFVPRGGHHWFDGDGMIHGVRLQADGNVNYVNRYVDTYRLAMERAVGGSLFPRIGEMKGWTGLAKLIFNGIKGSLGLLSASRGSGSANTAVQFHNGKLLALVENDEPYALKIINDGYFETMGRLTFGGKIGSTFSAHPKIDPETGEMLTFGYSVNKKPFCVYTVISEDGKVKSSIDIGLKTPVMMHDFAITKNYSLFLDFPLEFHPKDMVQKGFPFKFVDRPCRIGVIPRHASSAADMRWFEFAPGYTFHTLNAWEEPETNSIVLYGCHSNRVFLDSFMDNAEYLPGEGLPFLHEFRMNLETGETSERRLVVDEENGHLFGEFPTINPQRQGLPTRYGYVATATIPESGRFTAEFEGVAKVEITGGEGADVRKVGEITYGPGKFGGEAVFVPKVGGESEDDGYLLTFVFDENTEQSQFWIMDAKNMSPDPLAIIDLPQRVPYGFHGIWVSQDQIDSQEPL
eukprot:TRINITY_DN2956_c0_g1_i2.p1 TRINITY_DN2956_c0_g1~~TRINITY_DN2956_c0_g1_i2.p1  ORF type:complete len:504 (+),score=162.43 TRINITY_DN2956_c0_g1_i2:8-1519(+)